jgi:hypothetical protein
MAQVSVRTLHYVVLNVILILKRKKIFILWCLIKFILRQSATDVRDLLHFISEWRSQEHRCSFYRKRFKTKIFRLYYTLQLGVTTPLYNKRRLILFASNAHVTEGAVFFCLRERIIIARTTYVPKGLKLLQKFVTSLILFKLLLWRLRST